MTLFGSLQKDRLSCHPKLPDLKQARVVGDYLDAQAVQSGVPTYRERTLNLLGLIDVRRQLPTAGLPAIFKALSSAVPRGDGYRAWSFLHSVAEGLVALGKPDPALAQLRLAGEVGREHGYWIPAMDWVPAVTADQLETAAAPDNEPVTGLNGAALLVRSLATTTS